MDLPDKFMLILIFYCTVFLGFSGRRLSFNWNFGFVYIITI